MSRRLMAAVVVVVLGAAPAAAQTEDLPDPGMLPSNAVYSLLERAAEAIGTLLAFGDERKANRYLSLAEERLAEADALVGKDKTDKAEATLARYTEQLERAVHRAERVQGDVGEELSSRLAEATLKHLGVLAGVYERVPDQARAAIEQAMGASRDGHDAALRAVSADKRQELVERAETRVAELNRAREQGLPVPALEVEAEVEQAREGRAPATPPAPGGPAQAPGEAPPQTPGTAPAEAPPGAPGAPTPGTAPTEAPAGPPAKTPSPAGIPRR